MGRIEEGGRLTCGGREFVVPKATLRTCIDLEEVGRMITAGEVSSLVGLAGLFLAIVRPAHPDVTLADLLELPMGGPHELISALTEARTLAGLKVAQPGEAPSP